MGLYGTLLVGRGGRLRDCPYVLLIGGIIMSFYILHGKTAKKAAKVIMMKQVNN